MCFTRLPENAVKLCGRLSMHGYTTILVTKCISRNSEKNFSSSSNLCDLMRDQSSLQDEGLALAQRVRAQSITVRKSWLQKCGTSGHTVSAIGRQRGRWVFPSPCFPSIQHSAQAMAWCHPQFKVGLPYTLSKTCPIVCLLGDSKPG